MNPDPPPPSSVTLFLCGDIMLGRGVDQLRPMSADPRLEEEYVKDAREYVALAVETHGPIRRPVDSAYVWGDALGELERFAPAARIINLETSITQAGEHWPNKAIHYRMHPANVDCLMAAKVDVCALANNHVLDFGQPGLAETIATLRSAGIQGSGAGRNLDEARAPAQVQLPLGRILVFSWG